MPSTSCPRPHIGIGAILVNPEGLLLIGRREDRPSLQEKKPPHPCVGTCVGLYCLLGYVILN